MDRDEYRFRLVLLNACLCRLGRALREIHEQDLRLIEIMEKFLAEMKAREVSP